MTDTGALPPMPDRHTGQPRPPRAPARKVKGDYSVRWNARQVPQPPDTEAPVLEWCYANREEQLTQFFIALTIFVVGATLIDGGFDWMRTWWLWAIVAGGGLLILAGARTDRYSAGADWFMHRKEFVKTYELTLVKYNTDFGDGDVDLDDRHGGKARVSLTWIYRYPDLWDLVYNGIRHSVANGASVNDLAISRLNLEDVVHIRDQHLGRHPESGEP